MRTRIISLLYFSAYVITPWALITVYLFSSTPETDSFNVVGVLFQLVAVLAHFGCRLGIKGFVERTSAKIFKLEKEKKATIVRNRQHIKGWNVGENIDHNFRHLVISPFIDFTTTLAVFSFLQQYFLYNQLLVRYGNWKYLIAIAVGVGLPMLCIVKGLSQGLIRVLKTNKVDELKDNV